MPLRNNYGRWEYRFQVNGLKVQQSTGLEATERNRKKADQMEAVHHQAILEGRLGIQRLTPRAFNEAVVEFLQHEEINRGDKASTYKRIATSIASAREFFKTKIISMVDSGDVEKYKVLRLGEHKVQPVTCKHDLDSLSLFFQWAIRMNYARENPTSAVEKPSDKDAVREHILSASEERLYFAHAKGNLHDVARLILLQGFRPEEAIELRKDAVDLNCMHLRVVKGKSKAARRVLKLTPEAASILGRRMVGSSPWMFPSEKRPGRPITKLNCPHDRVCEKRRLNFVLYDLRHTFATRCIQHGVDVVALKDILGHTKIETTLRYVHLSQEHRDKAMDLYSASLDAPEKEITQ